MGITITPAQGSARPRFAAPIPSRNFRDVRPLGADCAVRSRHTQEAP